MDINKIILKAINSKASTEEYEALESWKAESEENIAFLEKMMADSKMKTDYREFDESVAWNKVESKIDAPKSNSKTWISILGIIMVLAVLYFVVFNEKTCLLYTSPSPRD